MYNHFNDKINVVSTDVGCCYQYLGQSTQQSEILNHHCVASFIPTLILLGSEL